MGCGDVLFSVGTHYAVCVKGMGILCADGLCCCRGAADSEGHTTWSGKAEMEDYVAFAGFMVYYLYHLGHSDDSDPYRLETIESVRTTNGQAYGSLQTTHHTPPITLLLGGYSYGSLILARLPPISSIVERFAAAELGTSAAEILLRARTLSKQTLRAMESAQSPSSPRGRQLQPDDAATSPQRRVGASPITMGGEETDPANRRRSRDSRRSGDLIRKSIETPQRIKARIKGSPARHAAATDDSQTTSTSGRSVDVPVVIPRYLLISPVLLPFSQTLCPPGPPSMFAGLRRHSNVDGHAGNAFHDFPTLAVFGSSDVFTASRRLKGWAERASRESKARFEWEEIAGAGHFWHEEGVMQVLQKRIADWTLEDR